MRRTTLILLAVLCAAVAFALAHGPFGGASEAEADREQKVIKDRERVEARTRPEDVAALHSLRTPAGFHRLAHCVGESAELHQVCFTSARDTKLGHSGVRRLVAAMGAPPSSQLSQLTGLAPIDCVGRRAHRPWSCSARVVIGRTWINVDVLSPLWTSAAVHKKHLQYITAPGTEITSTMIGNLSTLRVRH